MPSLYFWEKLCWNCSRITCCCHHRWCRGQPFSHFGVFITCEWGIKSFGQAVQGLWVSCKGGTQQLNVPITSPGRRSSSPAGILPCISLLLYFNLAWAKPRSSKSVLTNTSGTPEAPSNNPCGGKSFLCQHKPMGGKSCLCSSRMRLMRFLNPAPTRDCALTRVFLSSCSALGFLSLQGSPHYVQHSEKWSHFSEISLSRFQMLLRHSWNSAFCTTLSFGSQPKPVCQCRRFSLNWIAVLFVHGLQWDALKIRECIVLCLLLVPSAVEHI